MIESSTITVSHNSNLLYIFPRFPLKEDFNAIKESKMNSTFVMTLDLRDFKSSFDDITLHVEVNWDIHARGDWYFEGCLLELQTERITRKEGLDSD